MGGQMREELLDVAIEEGVESTRQSPHPFDVGVGDLEEARRRASTSDGGISSEGCGPGGLLPGWSCRCSINPLQPLPVCSGSDGHIPI